MKNVMVKTARRTAADWRRRLAMKRSMDGERWAGGLVPAEFAIHGARGRRIAEVEVFPHAVVEETFGPADDGWVDHAGAGVVVVGEDGGFGEEEGFGFAERGEA
jgi:hypothetical protein